MLTKEQVIEASKINDKIYCYVGENLDELDEETQNHVWNAYLESQGNLEDFDKKLEHLLYAMDI